MSMGTEQIHGVWYPTVNGGIPRGAGPHATQAEAEQAGRDWASMQSTAAESRRATRQMGMGDEAGVYDP
jgi:hypothetical protein